MQSAIEAAPGVTVERIGEMTGAGTNCGSCRSEVADIIARSTLKTAAE
ncbi:MAG: (2Fe-2S)-binding protein [Pseudomonadota bacterium]